VVRGAGADIWNTTEAFRFVYLPVTNNFVVTARLRSLDYTHSNAKAGLMIRESASTGNRLVGIGWLPQGRVEGLLRANAADPISTPWGPALSSAPWVRVTRNGTLLTASYSTDGNNWTTHVSTNLTVAANLIAGLYVCSHDSSETAEAVFDNLVVNRAPTLSPIANRNLNVGQWLAVTHTAFDPDSATTNLTFSLLSQPGGATLNPATGVLNWRPDTSRAGSSNWFNLSVTDDGWPSLSATQGFAVTVNPLAPVTLTSAVTGGSILNLSFTGQAGPDYTIQSSTNLATNAWVHVLTTNLTVPGPVLWLQSIPSGGEAQRFYRVVVGP
jgi:regulation of enolase protein 1 (concanavalin A-like superfamily)